MADFFQFEADFVESLRCIPMGVRLKLDTCGVKLKLSHWHQFSPGECQSLVDMPCTKPQEIAAYREFLQSLVVEKTGTPAKALPIEENPPWLIAGTVPEDTHKQAQEFNVEITVQQWEKLSPLQRFALIKLSRRGHENRNFYPALQEFKLV